MHCYTIKYSEAFVDYEAIRKARIERRRKAKLRNTALRKDRKAKNGIRRIYN